MPNILISLRTESVLVILNCSSIDVTTQMPMLAFGVKKTVSNHLFIRDGRCFVFRMIEHSNKKNVYRMAYILSVIYVNKDDKSSILLSFCIHYRGMIPLSKH